MMLSPKLLWKGPAKPVTSEMTLFAEHKFQWFVSPMCPRSFIVPGTIVFHPHQVFALFVASGFEHSEHVFAAGH